MVCTAAFVCSIFGLLAMAVTGSRLREPAGKLNCFSILPCAVAISALVGCGGNCDTISVVNGVITGDPAAALSSPTIGKLVAVL